MTRMLTISEMPHVVTLPREDALPGEHQAGTVQRVTELPFRFRTQALRGQQTTPEQRYPRKPKAPICPVCDEPAVGPCSSAEQDVDVQALNIAMSLEFKNLVVADFEASPNRANPKPHEIEDVIHDGRNNSTHKHCMKLGCGTKPMEFSRAVEVNQSAVPFQSQPALPFVAPACTLPYVAIGYPLGLQAVFPAAQRSAYSLLVDRFNMFKLLFPIGRPEQSYNFWSAANTIYVNVSRELAWTPSTSMTSNLVIGQLFGVNKSVMIPLRDTGRVDHAWELLSLSDEPEVRRIRDELEYAASAVLGPDGCKNFSFPYREPTTFRWESDRNRYLWLWLYMRYLGQSWNIPFTEIWDVTSRNGRRTLLPKYAWVSDELRLMPNVEEVLFLTLPGFSPPLGAHRSDPPLMAIDDRNSQVPISSPPCLIQGSEWDTYLEIPPAAMMEGRIDYSQYEMVTRPMPVC